MDDDDYPIYGEIWEVADCLLREPVLLLSCDYIQEVFMKNDGTLGEHLKVFPYLDCKSLEKIPKDKYHVFDKDIEFRKRRKEQIANQMGDEFELHEHWMEKYGNSFKEIHTKCDIEEKKHKNEENGVDTHRLTGRKTRYGYCFSGDRLRFARDGK